MNRTIIIVLLVLLVGVVGLGFYRGWFAFSRPAADTGSNKVNVNLTVDPDKVKEDAAAVKERTAELTGRAKAGANASGDQATEGK